MKYIDTTKHYVIIDSTSMVVKSYDKLYYAEKFVSQHPECQIIDTQNPDPNIESAIANIEIIDDNDETIIEEANIEEISKEVPAVATKISEEELRKHRVCFTGHRPQGLTNINPEDIRVSLHDCITRAYAKGFTTFITGMAIGVDQIAAEEVIKFRAKHNDVKLIAAVPCLGQDSKWPEQVRNHYAELLNDCDARMLIHNGEYNTNTKCMTQRNEWMVNHSSVVISVWNGNPYTGTGNCIRYATKCGIPVLNATTNKLVSIK